MCVCVCVKQSRGYSPCDRSVVKSANFSADEVPGERTHASLWNWMCAASPDEISLTRLVSEALIVLWLLYYLLSSRYLALPNSFKRCVDSENKPEEQRPGGIWGSDCTASSPPAWPGLQWGVWRKRWTVAQRPWSSASEQVRLKRFL